MKRSRSVKFWLIGLTLAVIVGFWSVDEVIELCAVKFEGHSARYWFREYCMVRQPSTNAINHALEMLVGMGSNAAPVLVHRMNMPDSTWRPLYAKLVRPLGPIRNYLPAPISPDYVRKTALIVFSKNKLAARAAKEELIKGYENSDPFYRLYCLRALAQINLSDSKIDDLLIRACSDQEASVRNLAAYALAYNETTSEKGEILLVEIVKRYKLGRFLESSPSTLELDLERPRTKDEVIRRYVESRAQKDSIQYDR